MKQYRRTIIVVIGFLAMSMAALGKEVLSHINAGSAWSEVWTPWIFFSVLATMGVSMVGWLFPSPAQQLEEWKKEKENGGTINPNP